MAEHRCMTDSELTAAIATGALPDDISLVDVCHELQRLRFRAANQNRKAEQIRKLRWSVENVLVKVERMEETEDRTVNEIEQQTADAIALWLSDEHDELDMMPLPERVTDAVRAGAWK